MVHEAAEKCQKKYFQLDLSKEALISKNGQGGRRLRQCTSAPTLIFQYFCVTTCFHEETGILLDFRCYNYAKKVRFLCFLVIQRLKMVHEAAEKCQKKIFELDLSKEALISENGQGGRRLRQCTSTPPGRTISPGLGHMASPAYNCPFLTEICKNARFGHSEGET